MRALLLVLVLSSLLGGCLAHRTLPAGLPTAGAAGVAIPPVPQQPVLFRHAVRLEIRGQKAPLTFDGMLGFDAGQDSARAVALGGFGLKLFDLTVTRSSTQTHMLHPALARIPGIVDHIAFCIRRIWLDSRPSENDLLRREHGQDILCATQRGQQLEHVLAEGRRLSTRALGPDETWTILFSDHDPVTLEPRHVVFTDGHDRYRLDIRTIPQ